MNSNSMTPTTKSGTSMDAVLTRFLDYVQSKSYISHFSYPKPIISVVPIQPSSSQSMKIIEIHL